jgi:GGDEF domain-containing protein
MALYFASLFAVYVGGEIWAASRYEDIQFELSTTVQQVAVLLVVGGAAANYRQLNAVFSMILNRRDALDNQQERRRAPGDGFAVVYIDIAVADGLPAQMTPESLREVVAKRISGAVRQEDQVLTSDADAFVVLLEGLHELMDATVVGERILKRLESPVSVGGRSVEVDPRVGVAYSPNRVGSPDELIEAAGRKAFGARRDGEDRLVIHDTSEHLESAAG